jgi:hypothetical protein
LFGQTQSAFYEISTPTTYTQSVKDTKADIHDIEQLLHEIVQLEKKKKQTDPPEELMPLVHLLDQYYGHIRTSLTLLLIHESVQVDLLEISGDRYNALLTKLEVTKDPQAYLGLLGELADMSAGIADALEAYEFPEGERDVFNPIVKQHRLQADYFGSITAFVSRQESDITQKITTLTAAFGQEMETARNSVASEGETYIRSSPVATGFRNAAELERQIQAFIEGFRDE